MKKDKKNRERLKAILAKEKSLDKRKREKLYKIRREQERQS